MEKLLVVNYCLLHLYCRGWSLVSGLQMETNYIQSHTSGLELENLILYVFRVSHDRAHTIQHTQTKASQ